jgi:hypothetical protein
MHDMSESDMSDSVVPDSGVSDSSMCVHTLMITECLKKYTPKWHRSRHPPTEQPHFASHVKCERPITVLLFLPTASSGATPTRSFSLS